jgi:hypothetical protein
MTDLLDTYAAVLYGLRNKYAATRKQRITWLVIGVSLILIPVLLAVITDLAWLGYFLVGAAIVLGITAIAISYNRGSKTRVSHKRSSH